MFLFILLTVLAVPCNHMWERPNVLAGYVNKMYCKEENVYILPLKNVEN